MKKPTKKQLHKNFILIHNFFYEGESIKKWVMDDVNYDGGYHEDISFMFEIIKKIGQETGYELIIGYSYCHWNKFGNNPLEDHEFGGYEDTLNIYMAVVEFIKQYNTKNK